jgi:tetratricopeptide (TPR) repeat protein
MGHALLRAGKLKEAKRYFDKAIKIYEPEENTHSQLADVYYFRGECYYKMKQTENACLDWSKSGEYGNIEAYETIKQYCK